MELSLSNQKFKQKKNLYSRPCFSKNKIFKCDNQVYNKNIKHASKKFCLPWLKKKKFVFTN